MIARRGTSRWTIALVFRPHCARSISHVERHRCHQGLMPYRGPGKACVAVPTELRTTTLRLAGDKLSYSTPLGTSFTATLGGSFAPVRSAHAADVQVAVRRTGPRQIEERVKQDGKETIVRTYTISASGRSMEVASTDLTQGTTFRATSRLQRLQVDQSAAPVAPLAPPPPPPSGAVCRIRRDICIV